MQDRRWGMAALIGGSLLTIAVFLFHPSHITERDVMGMFSATQIIHVIAIVAAPLLTFGMWEMSRWVDRPIARLGLVAAALAMVLTVNAAVVSGFVTPAAAKASSADSSAPAAHGPAPVQARHGMAAMPTRPPLVQLSVALNRGLAQAHVTLLSLGLLMFGIALWSRLPVLSLSGILVGAVPLLWQLSGRFSPETHTMPLIVLPQCAWLIAAAVLMVRAPKPEEQTL